jgi:hypothetical protein
MAEEEKTKLRLEIGHVLLIDVVDYSKLLINQQSEQLRELNEIVSSTNHFARALEASAITMSFARCPLKGIRCR